MIIAEWKPLPEIIAALEGFERCLLVGCATCVAECAAGGEREVETLAPLIRMGMKQAGHPIKVFTRTVERQCEWEFVEPLSELIAGSRIDVVVSLACGIGVQALAERFETLPVQPAVNTTALAMREAPGLWTARCAACGDCRLGDTFGLCPVARCAKSLSNGPCGGTRSDGACEVDVETPCVWHRIVERAKARGALERLTVVHGARNWSNSRHGGPKRMLRDDHRP